jgi:hypothetical protein
LAIFDFIASTGRTATTYIATSLDTLPGVVACHEGYAGGDKDKDPVLPLINLENAQAYADPKAAGSIVANKRSTEAIESAANSSGAERVVDVAYYNPMICRELLRAHSNTRMLGIIRNCADFVRSSTTLTGEDPLPVGWADKDKELSQRERFIGMGRIRPRKGTPEKQGWAEWSAIRKNIWLWEETNKIICAAKAEFSDRVLLTRFETFQSDPDKFWTSLTTFLELPPLDLSPSERSEKGINKKPFGYQIGSAETWSPQEQAELNKSQNLIDKSAIYDC